MNIDYLILDKNKDIQIDKIIRNVSKKRSIALIIKKDYFEKDSRSFNENKSSLVRKEVIHQLLNIYDKDTIFISTTGKTSRELYELNKKLNRKAFYCIGGMGHASSIAAGVALNNPNKRVVCLDGDGSFLMHMGFTPIIGSLNLENFHHYVLNNFSHESVGGQPTVGKEIDFDKISMGSNYDSYYKCQSLNDLNEIIKKFKNNNETSLIEVLINTNSDTTLPRPDKKPIEYLEFF